MGQVPALQGSAQGAQQLQALTRAALADDTGRALDEMLAGLHEPGEDAGQPSFPSLTRGDASVSILSPAGDTP